MSVFISVILYFSIFIDHLHHKIVFLSQVSGRNQCSISSNPETYTACNHPQQPFLCLSLSAEMRKAEKDIKFCSRTCTKLLWIPILAYQGPLNKFCQLCFNLIQSLSGSLSSEWTLGNVHTIWSTQEKKTSFIYVTGNNYILKSIIKYQSIIWSL